MNYKVQNTLRFGLLITLFLFALQIGAKAQTPVSSEEKNALVDSISSSWDDWTTVAIDGKLKMASLPVTPSVKMYMERDSCILISLRAPFFGEVGRAEITDSTVLVVNKMKKKYVEEPLDSLKDCYPVDLRALQEIFLGRISFPGLGLLSHEIEDAVDLYLDEEGYLSLVANDGIALFPDINYGYVVSPDFWPVALLVLPEKKPDVSVTLSFDYFEDGYDLNFKYQSEKRNFQAVMEFNEPNWDGKPMERMKLNPKFKRVGLQEFWRSF